MKYCTLILCALLVSGCALFTKDDATRPMDLVEFEPTINLESVWRRNVGVGTGKGVVQLQPAIDGDVIYAADARGRVQAFNRFNGARQWRQRTGYEITGGVGVSNGLVLFGTRQGEVVALSSEDGEELWRTNLTSEVVSVPNTDGATVVAQTIDGKLFAMDAKTGENRWRYETPAPILTLRGSGQPLFTGSMVVAGFANGKVIAFNTRNGLIQWEYRVALPQGRSELDRMVDISASPLLHETVIYAASYQGRVVALNRSNGRPLWAADTSTHQDLAIAGRTLFVSEANSRVTAYRSTSGEILWQNDQMLRRYINGPQVLGDYVAVADFKGYLHVMNQSDGEFVARRRVNRRGVSGSMKSDGDILYVYGDRGRLQAFRIAD
ncbi:outer membrane protein assembly factor BamB [Marinimicrobium sp. ABcell2]|uniref:outer membrane protein assembly factor BamB n=1 Tax=Marinimicrobium sp. ABcell2 TaxID=3069751 RepID=UPI0027B2C652|nr:outer membrane protein assembly factor BamB [Marinimicrobium sp. ABcell2]MDQ2077270.1 outer membrane protein assembly factor BamB [Marinimicrobium sp. ABcell2]